RLARCEASAARLDRNSIGRSRRSWRGSLPYGRDATQWSQSRERPPAPPLGRQLFSPPGPSPVRAHDVFPALPYSLSSLKILQRRNSALGQQLALLQVPDFGGEPGRVGVMRHHHDGLSEFLVEARQNRENLLRGR